MDLWKEACGCSHYSAEIATACFRLKGCCEAITATCLAELLSHTGEFLQVDLTFALPLLIILSNL